MLWITFSCISLQNFCDLPNEFTEIFKTDTSELFHSRHWQRTMRPLRYDSDL